MREIICLHIGQAGVQMGNSIWELLSTEHGIDETGMLKEPSFQIESVDSFFALSHANKYVPRSIFVDLEATVIDEVRSGSYRKFFHPDRLISGPEDAASNFARGFFTVGKLLLGVISHEIRKLLETGTCTNAIFIFRSLGGGTGSGLTSAIFDSLIEYPKLTKIEMPIYPSPTLSTAMVEPYNCLLSEHFCMEDIDVGLLIDNEALYDVCSKYLSISHASYNTINRLIGQLTSSITASVRFESVMNCDITVLQTNLVPYPRIHFPLANFAPVLSAAKAVHEELTVNDITRAVFEKENQMMKIDHSFGRFMSCCLLYRGNISPYHVYIALNEIKRDKNIEFVDWCPTGFKVGINICPPTSIPESQICQTTKNVTMLANTSAIGQAWQRITHKFYLLYSKRSFVHWFIGEGMEECEFTESLYNISALVKDYEEVIGDADNKPESNQQNQCVSDKGNSSENPNQLNEMYMENTNLIGGKGGNDENESEFGKSCVKYQVSVSEPETAEVEEETNEETRRNNYEYNENIEEKVNESLNEEEVEEEVEEVGGEEEDEGEVAGEGEGEGEVEEEGGEEEEGGGEGGEEGGEETEEVEEEGEVESTDNDKESDDENENCNVGNKKISSNINNCASILESLFTCKDQSSTNWRKKTEDSKFLLRKFNKKPMKKIYKKRIGNIQFHY